MNILCGLFGVWCQVMPMNQLPADVPPYRSASEVCAAAGSGCIEIKRAAVFQPVPILPAHGFTISNISAGEGCCTEERGSVCWIFIGELPEGVMLSDYADERL